MMQNAVRWLRGLSTFWRIIASIVVFLAIYILLFMVLLIICGQMPTTWLATEVMKYLLVYVSMYLVLRIVWKHRWLGLCLVMYLTSCVGTYYDRDPDTVHVISDTNIIVIDASVYTIAEYDGCSYLIAKRDNSITHIGSCHNPIHKLHYCDTLIVHDTVVVKEKM